MGILRSIETGIERVVEGTVGRAFRASVQPVEIARKLAKELEDGKVVSVNRTYAPNEFTVYLHPKDRTVFSEYEASLRAELAVYLADHARREGYTLLTRPRVVFETDQRLSNGTFGIGTALVSPEDHLADGDAPVPPSTQDSGALASSLPALGGLQAGTPLVEPPLPEPPLPEPPLPEPPLPLPSPPLPSPPLPEPPPLADLPELSPLTDPPPVEQPVLPLQDPPELETPQPVDTEPEPVPEPATATGDTAVQAAPVSDAAALVVSGRRIQIEAAATVIGRAAGCDIVVDDSGASRRHAEVRRRGQQVVIVDLDSTNGTVVNGRRVREHPLAHGDRIVVGTTTMVFERPA